MPSCPVCYSPLDFEPWFVDSASDEICPTCGIQFGYDDARPDLRTAIYEAWRRAFLAGDGGKVDPETVQRPWPQDG